MTAIECALNNRLIFDISCQTKKSTILCSCNLKSCHDLNIYSFASLAMQRVGAPRPAVEIMFETIQHLLKIWINPLVVKIGVGLLGF